MTAGACSATVRVLGLGTYPCERTTGHEIHTATLPSENWASVSWIGDTATIGPPGSRRGQL